MKFLTVVIISLWGLTLHINANEETNQTSISIIKEMVKTNELYLQSTSKNHFQMMINKQNPRITLVSCSDSRVQNNAIDSSPENDLFVIRNIGNQLISNEGSISYGIKHLHTPILLIMGHSRCGAIKAAMSDYSEEDSAIRKEISTLSLSIKNTCTKCNTKDWIKNIVNNVHQQVAYALQDYQENVDKKKLMIIGAVFDFANDMEQGHGKINIININGEDVKGQLKEIKIKVQEEKDTHSSNSK